MGSKQPSTVTQKNTTELRADQVPISNAASSLAQNYATTPLQLPNYQQFDQQVLGFSPEETAGQDAVLAAARGSMTDLARQAASTNSFLMDPALLSPDSNPYLRQQGDAVTTSVTDNLLQKIFPALRSGSVVAGGSNSGGNTRFGIAQGQAVGDTNKGLSQALANLYGGAYQNGLQTLAQAVANNPSVMKQQLAPGVAEAGVGQQRRELAQAQATQGVNNQQSQANLATQRAWLEQQLPYLQAQQLYGLISAAPGGTSGTSTVTGATPSSGGIQGALGGAATGASIGSMIPGVGTVVGGGLGALLGLL